MEPRRFDQVEAYQHADDEYYYRPVVAGKELFTYVAHVPTGGVMPPDAEEAELFELSLFMLEGELQISLGGEQMVLRQADALHVPRGVAFGVENRGEKTATFVLSFSPPPDVDLETMRASAESRGRVVLDAEEVEERFGPFGILQEMPPGYPKNRG